MRKFDTVFTLLSICSETNLTFVAAARHVLCVEIEQVAATMGWLAVRAARC